NAGHIILVEDDDDLARAIMQGVTLAGYTATAHRDASAALAAIDPAFPGVVVSDLRMPGMDGWQFFAALTECDADIPIIFITGHGSISDAVAALKQGAYDFVAKPFAMDRLLGSIARAMEKRRLVLDNRQLRAAALAATAQPATPMPLAGDSPAMVQLRSTLAHIGDAEIDVLIEGEAGTGRDRIARLLHDSSRRRSRAFASVNCAAAPQALLEDELFGTEEAQGSRRRVGRIDFANRGTLFLDGIEAMPIATQIRLGAALDSGDYIPNGGNSPRAFDLRVIAATSGDPGMDVAAGRLRPELLFRLGAIRIRIPPLRERREDVPLLYARFAAEAARRFHAPIPAIDGMTHAHLLGHNWPGNLRELAQFAERNVLGLGREQAVAERMATLPERMAIIEAGMIREALTAAGGRIPEVQRLLGIPRKTLYDKLNRHNLNPASFRR
ncbi:MAG: C4-dicarboxylate transport transcriptional regulatory protein DctD, partial [Pseudomonadota bacterium]